MQGSSTDVAEVARRSTQDALCVLQEDSACSRHIQSLQTHLKQTPASVLAELVLLATVAALCCNHKGRGVKPSASMIITALLQIRLNGLAVEPRRHTDVRDRYALAVYPMASLVNHACQPNVALSFEGSRLTARATEPIMAGAPVLHCYGPQRGALITAVRQQELRDQYHFLCRCRGCQAGFDKSEQGMVGLWCLDTTCDGVVVPKQGIAKGICSADALPGGIGNDCCSRSARLPTLDSAGASKVNLSCMLPALVLVPQCREQKAWSVSGSLLAPL